MRRDRKPAGAGNRAHGVYGEAAKKRVAPGKRTRTMGLWSAALQRKPSSPGQAPIAADNKGDAAEAMEGAAQSQGEPLPDGLRESMEQSVGANLSGVRVHTGSESQAAAEAINARAYATGQDIHFGAGHYDPAVEEGKRLLAHEVAHTIQQQGSASNARQAKLSVSEPGDQLERDADAFADAFVAGRSAEPIAGARAGPAIARKERSPAQSADSVGETSTGREYAIAFELAILSGCMNILPRLPLPAPGAHSSWTRDAKERFLSSFAFEIAEVGGRRDGWSDRVLRRVLAPAKLDSLVNSGRLLGGNDKDDEPIGPTRWFPGVAAAIADALYRRVCEALARVVPRYVAARAALAAEPDPVSKRRPSPPEPSATSVGASHPADYVAARVLCSGGFLRVDVDGFLGGDEMSEAGEAAPSEAAPSEAEAASVIWGFAEDEKATNWIVVTLPPSPTAELVATALWGSPQEARRLTAQPPLFGLSQRDARALRRRRGEPDPIDDGTLAGSMRSAMAVATDRGPAHSLLESGMADWAALEQAGEPQGVADRGKLEKSMARTRIQLDVCRELLQPFGLGGRTQKAAARLDERTSALAAAPLSEVGKWQLHAAKQHDVVFGATMGLQSIRDHLRNMGVDKPQDIERVPANVRQPLTRVAAMYAEALELSHVVAMAKERLDGAHQELALAPLATLDLMLADIQAKIEHAGAMGAEHMPGYGEGKYAPEASEQVDLRIELSQVRAMVLNGDPQAGERIKALYERVDKLQLKTDIGLNYAVFHQLMLTFHDLKWDAWVVAGQASDDAEDWSGRVWEYGGKFKVAWQHFRRGELEQAKEIIADVMADEGFHTILKKAHAKLDDIQTRAAIAKIAAIIGITLVSMGAGAVVGGAAAGATGTTLASATPFIIGAATEAATFAALDAAILQSDDAAGSFLSDFAFNLATFGMLRALRLRKAAKLAGAAEDTLPTAGKADEAMLATKADAAGEADTLGRLRGYVVKGKEASAQAAVIAATTFAQMQYEQYRAAGRYLSTEDVRAIWRQGLAMFIGVAIGGRAIARLEELGKRAGKRAKDYVELRKLARQVETKKSPELANELLQADRRLLEADRAELEAQYRNEGRDIPEHLRGEYEAKLAEIDLLEIQMSFDEVVPGRHYMGDQAQVEAHAAKLKARGATVQRITDASTGQVRYLAIQGERRVELHVDKGRGSQRVESGSSDGDSGGGRKADDVGGGGAGVDAGELGDPAGRRNRGEPYQDPRIDPDLPRRHLGRRELLPAKKIPRHASWGSAARALKRQDSVAVGKVIKSPEEGHCILAGLASGDASALKKLGIDDYPEGLDVTGREWALVETRNGYVVYTGKYNGIALPNEVRIVAHTHPGPNPTAEFGTRGKQTPVASLRIPEGGEGLSYDEIIADWNAAKNAGITPSAPDIHACSDGSSQVIYTRYVHRGDKRIDNPRDADEGSRIALHLANTRVLRWHPRSQTYYYEVDMWVRDASGAELWAGKIYAEWNAAYPTVSRVLLNKPALLRRQLAQDWKEP